MNRSQAGFFHLNLRVQHWVEWRSYQSASSLSRQASIEPYKLNINIYPTK